ncbi:MAG: phenylacetate--CoA ligase family protein [Spirochaetota bacterium]
MEGDFWDPEVETISRRELEELQLECINRSLSRAERSAFYRDRGLPEAVDSLVQVARLPFTTKQDLRDAFPCGMLAVPLESCVRLHSSSGTTGRATVVYHTAGDIDAWTELVARSMYMTGVRRGDVFQNMMGYGLFTGGLGLHYGSERLGALTIPASSGNSRRQIYLMRDFGTTVLHITPSYALHLHSLFAGEGIDPREDLHLRAAFLGAEPYSEQTRAKIEELYGIDAFNSYGLSEMNGPGVAFECRHKQGMHLWEDSYYLEVIDPETGRPLPDGEEGELVLTTLAREAMPLIRYRTGDITTVCTGECPCGRTHRRISRIKGRSDDMLIVKGVNIYPMQIEQVLMNVPGVGHNYLIELDRDEHLDIIRVKVEVGRDIFHGRIDELEELKRRVARELKEEILITPRVVLVEPGSLPAGEGKAVRVRDLRADNR